jgi:serpin B
MPCGHSRGHPFLPEYLSLVATHHQAFICPLDYTSAGARVASRDRINEWVQDRTHGLIRDLIQPFDLLASTRLVVTNAVYFKGAWAGPFDPSRTKSMPFDVTLDRCKQVAMMNHTGSILFLGRVVDPTR